MKYASIFILFILSLTVFGQGKIYLFNGNQISVDSIGSKDINNNFHYTKPGSQSLHKIKAKKIFSIENKDGKEDVLFKPDTANGDFPIPQMKSYLIGVHDSRETYQAPNATFGGVLVGTASGFLGIIYGPVPVALYAAIVSVRYPTVANQPIVNTSMVNDEYYQYGYQIYAKRKKLKNAAISGGISLITSFIILKKYNQQIDSGWLKFRHNIFGK